MQTGLLMNNTKLTTGFYFKLKGLGEALSWGVAKQVKVALSSSESEYLGMAASVQFYRTPKQSGLAERCDRTLLETSRRFRIESGLPMTIREAAILHAARIRNLVVTRGADRCPAEFMRGIIPKLSISKLHNFGGIDFMRKTGISANLNPKHWKESFVTLRVTMDT